MSATKNAVQARILEHLSGVNGDFVRVSYADLCAYAYITRRTATKHIRDLVDAGLLEIRYVVDDAGKRRIEARNAVGAA